MNSAAAALFFEDFVRTMSSPPTTETLPPGPAGTGEPDELEVGYWRAKIGYIHGPSRIVAYLPVARPSLVAGRPRRPG